MTEKRFTLKHYEDTDWAYDNGKSIYVKEMVELLNALHEENEQLKKENQELKNYLLHLGYKAIYHDGHISLEQIEIKKMEIRNNLLDGWIE